MPKPNTPKQSLSSGKTVIKIAAPTSVSKKDKATNAATIVKKGEFKKGARKIRTSIKFRATKSFKEAKNPAFPKKSVKKVSKMTEFRVLKAPLATESATKKIETNNTLTFMCDMFANKIQIAQAVSKMYDVKVIRVNTLVTPLGEKKAYVKLDAAYDAADVANKMGLL